MDDLDLEKYYTPEWAVRALIRRIRLADLNVAEPCAGEGHIADVLREETRCNSVVTGDIDPEADTVTTHDARDREIYLPNTFFGAADVIITNPPYSGDRGSASEVLEPMINVFNGPVFALLRISFLEPASGRWPLLEQLDSVLMLPRVEYEVPDDEKYPGNQMTSAWLGWFSGTQAKMSRGTLQYETVSKRERNRLMGQVALPGTETEVEEWDV